jgi:hypothetical protein
VITCDVPQINEKLSSDSTLLDKMYAILEGSSSSIFSFYTLLFHNLLIYILLIHLHLHLNHIHLNHLHHHPLP